MDFLNTIGSWISENESLLSRIAAIIVLVESDIARTHEKAPHGFSNRLLVAASHVQFQQRV